SLGQGSAPAGDGDPTPGAEERRQIEHGLRELRGRLQALRSGGDRASGDRRDRLADAEVFAKGIAWALTYDATLTPADLKLLGMSELRFIGRFDEGDGPAPDVPDRDYIELHPLGRVENGYRWAGETDVFEAVEAACRNYNVDRDRIVLRGMSMGASGTWHL